MKRLITLLAAPIFWFLLALIAMLVITAGCSSMRHADWNNPCTDKMNCEECIEWKQKYPKEFKRYAGRMYERGYKNICK